MRRTLFAIMAMFNVSVWAMNIKSDMQDCCMERFFTVANTRYVIRHSHTFTDTVKIPKGCEIRFAGGSLFGPIVFDGTRLSGDVNLRGCTISGSVSNKQFRADWLCYRDGVHDDAANINAMIQVCGKVYFPKGTYRLVGLFEPIGLSAGYQQKLISHIGIGKSNVTLTGEDGAMWVSDVPVGVLSVYSSPNQIANSIRNIRIDNLTFRVDNDGKSFHEFMPTIRIIGVNGCTIRDCRFEDFWGDAIGLSHYGDTPKTGERTRNQHVRILNNVITGGDHHNNRNGISVINGKNVLIRGNTIRNTSRHDMPGGIDVEPNNAAYTIENIRIEKNTFDGIRGSCGAIEICMFNGGPGHYIYVQKNTIRNSNRGLYVYLKTDNTTDHFVIKDNYVAEDTRPYQFVGSGKSRNWTITGNVFKQRTRQAIPGDIKVERLKVRNR